METTQLKEIAKVSFDKMATDELVFTLKQYSNDYREAIDIAFDAITDILMDRLSASDFIELCNSL